MDRPSWAPTDVDRSQPGVAPIYGHDLGGSHNVAADRDFGVPETAQAAPSSARVVHVEHDRPILADPGRRD